MSPSSRLGNINPLVSGQGREDGRRRARNGIGNVVEHMRQQMAMKEARVQARARGLTVEAYLQMCEEEARQNAEAEHLGRLSESLAAKIADRMREMPIVVPLEGGTAPASPKPDPRIAFDDLQGIVDHLLQKGKP